MSEDRKRLTTFQVELMKLVRAGNPDNDGDGPIDFDQLLDRLSWHPSKAAAHFSIRALIRRKLLEKTEMILRRGRRRAAFVLTAAGVEALDPRGPSVPVVRLPKVEEADLEVISDGLPGSLPGSEMVVED